MAASLPSCPVEVVESIIKLLSLDDVRNLRLTCRSVAAKSVHGSFRSYFRSKHVELTIESLDACLRLVTEGGLPSLVRDLYLVGIAEPTQSEPDRTPEVVEAEESDQNRQVALLTKLFNEVAKRSGYGNPSSLALRVAVAGSDGQRILPIDEGTEREPTWYVWSRATQTFLTAFRALSLSTLQIRSLNIFNEPDLQLCSLATQGLASIEWDNRGLAQSLAPVTSLSISTSDSYKKEYRRWRDLLYEDDCGYPGVAKLVSLCRGLENFDWHSYSNRHRFCPHRVGPFLENDRILRHLVVSVKLPLLRQCRLRGITAREGDLITFIKRTRPSKLFIESCHAKGSWKPIIDYFTSPSANLSCLSLDTLRQWTGPPLSLQLVTFAGPKESRIDIAGDCSERMVREGVGVRDPVAYSDELVAFLPTPLTKTWWEYQMTEYGY